MPKGLRYGKALFFRGQFWFHEAEECIGTGLRDCYSLSPSFIVCVLDAILVAMYLKAHLLSLVVLEFQMLDLLIKYEL